MGVGVGMWVCAGVGVQSCSVREPLPFPSLATQLQSAPKSLEQQQLGMCSDYTIGAWTQHRMQVNYSNTNQHHCLYMSLTV